MEYVNFLELVNEKGIIEDVARIKELVEGQTFKVVACTNGHGYRIGSIIKFDSTLGSHVDRAGERSCNHMLMDNGRTGNHIYYGDMHIQTQVINKDNLVEQIDTFTKEISELEEKIDAAKSSIKMLEENGVDEMTGDEFAAMNIIATLSKVEMAPLDRAKAVIKMIKR